MALKHLGLACSALALATTLAITPATAQTSGATTAARSTLSEASSAANIAMTAFTVTDMMFKVFGGKSIEQMLGIAPHPLTAAEVKQAVREVFNEEVLKQTQIDADALVRQWSGYDPDDNMDDLRTQMQGYTKEINGLKAEIVARLIKSDTVPADNYRTDFPVMAPMYVAAMTMHMSLLADYAERATAAAQDANNPNQENDQRHLAKFETDILPSFLSRTADDLQLIFNTAFYDPSISTSHLEKQAGACVLKIADYHFFTSESEKVPNKQSEFKLDFTHEYCPGSLGKTPKPVLQAMGAKFPMIVNYASRKTHGHGTFITYKAKNKSTNLIEYHYMRAGTYDEARMHRSLHLDDIYAEQFGYSDLLMHAVLQLAKSNGDRTGDYSTLEHVIDRASYFLTPEELEQYAPPQG